MLSLEERQKIVNYIIANEDVGTRDKALSQEYKDKIQEIVNSLTLEDIFEIDDMVMTELSKKK